MISHQLHSSKLILGLPRALAGYCREFSQQRGIKVEFTQKGFTGPAPQASPSSQCSVCCRRRFTTWPATAGQLRLRFFCLPKEMKSDSESKDRGKGFDPVQVSDGLGLVSMRERLRL